MSVPAEVCVKPATAQEKGSCKHDNMQGPCPGPMAFVAGTLPAVVVMHVLLSKMPSAMR